MGAKMSKLYENILIEIGKQTFNKMEIPSHIRDNLSKELREYQQEALKFYMANNDTFKKNHLMFNMATGSGKTVVMAALMLDCYKRGYRDFVFFVNSHSILEKTKENFVNKYSNKYLFNENILIKSENIEINTINNLDESKENAINIYFTTIQSLFSLFKYERENALTLQDLENKKLVFLADEAHHLNSNTKKLNKTEQENIDDWETIINKAFNTNDENLLLEFSATIPKDKNVAEKYQDKIIYEYDLKKFCGDGYAKRILLFKYESDDLNDRFLGALLMSLYRELVANKKGEKLKPVILFKSENIATSKENQCKFIDFLDNIDGFVIEDFYKNINFENNEILKQHFDFYKTEFKEAMFGTLARFLKNNFKKEYILNTNDDKEVEQNQLLLNSLEDRDNLIRIIFAVDKLNEGWDVLNLFDIVRLGKGSKKSYTTKEAQLIGRGARYCPFLINEFDDELRYKRKFDNDLNNELSILERLTYHTLNEVSFIEDLNKSIREYGLLLEDTKEKIHLKPNPTLKEKIKNEKIFYAKNNKQVKKEFKINIEDVKTEIRKIEIPLISKDILLNEEDFKESKKDSNDLVAKNINSIENQYFLKAMNILQISFNDIEIFNCSSKKDFIENYLGKISILFHKKQSFTTENKLEIAKFILESFKTIKEKMKQEYEISDFKVYEFEMKERIIFTTKHKDDLNYEWLYYKTILKDSQLEIDFLNFIDSRKNEIDNIFSKWFVVRNEGFEEFKLYDDRKDKESYLVGFEPDFIFFGKKKNKDFFSIECFIEAKGKHLEGNDSWKEEFLAYLKYKNPDIRINHKLNLYGLPFFRQVNDERFINAYNEFLAKD
ncbi:DEAD/DEAH box helicase [Helicobacter sp. 16-1353]|nr:DEAD/DEAH box helicase [Helicobacter sp. 16-1353]